MIYNFFDLSSVIFLQVAPTYMMSCSSIDHQLGDKRHKIPSIRFVNLLPLSCVSLQYAYNLSPNPTKGILFGA